MPRPVARRCGSRVSIVALETVATVPIPWRLSNPASPPALSLLVLDAEPTDQSLQALLSALRSKCGTSVSAAETMNQFGLVDVVTEAWPDQLPVRCES